MANMANLKTKTKKNNEYAIARKCIKEFVETKNFFSLYAIGQYIKEKGGVLRTSTGVSVKEYLDDLVEAKGAYKPAALIESLVSPTVDVVYKIRPVLNIKDSSAEMSKRRNKKQK